MCGCHTVFHKGTLFTRTFLTLCTPYESGLYLRPFLQTSSYPEKLKTLVQLVKDLMDVGNKKIMVFVGQKRTADILASYLSDDKVMSDHFEGWVKTSVLT